MNLHGFAQAIERYLMNFPGYNINVEAVRIWLCDCGRVHVETRHCRVTFMPAEFLAHLRRAAGESGARAIPPQQPTYQDEACVANSISRAARSPITLEPVL
jgi:hypothetical protein